MFGSHSSLSPDSEEKIPTFLADFPGFTLKDTRLETAVEGGELLAFGSANPRTPENYDEGSFTTCYGRAQAVVRAEKAGMEVVTYQQKGGKEQDRVRHLCTA